MATLLVGISQRGCWRKSIVSQQQSSRLMWQLSYNLVICHNPKYTMKGCHVCGNSCTPYPLQTCANVCDVISMVVAVVTATLRKEYRKPYKTKPQYGLLRWVTIQRSCMADVAFDIISWQYLHTYVLFDALKNCLICFLYIWNLLFVLNFFFFFFAKLLPGIINFLPAVKYSPKLWAWMSDFLSIIFHCRNVI